MMLRLCKTKDKIESFERIDVRRTKTNKQKVDGNFIAFVIIHLMLQSCSFEVQDPAFKGWMEMKLSEIGWRRYYEKRIMLSTWMLFTLKRYRLCSRRRRRRRVASNRRPHRLSYFLESLLVHFNWNVSCSCVTLKWLLTA